MNAEVKAYKRLVDAAVDAADRLQRCKLKLDREAGNKLLEALLDFDGEHVAFLSAGKSDPETAVAVTDHKENFPRPMASSRTGYALQNSPCNRLQAPPATGQI